MSSNQLSDEQKAVGLQAISNHLAAVITRIQKEKQATQPNTDKQNTGSSSK